MKMNIPKQRKKTLRTDARALVESCAGWNSRLAARRITQFLDREMADLGLSAAQLGLLAQIAVIADDTLGALALRTGLEQSTLSRNLRTLENAGLVEIAVVESDLRRRAVWLTETGARRLEAAIPVWRRAHARLAKHLSPDLARNLADRAEALQASIERGVPRSPPAILDGSGNRVEATAAGFERRDAPMPQPIATIGYEKATPDQVIDALRAAGIDMLVDIRAVARSRRPGFSKGNLSAAAEAAGIRYLHLRGLGTPTEGREANKAGRMDDFEAIYRAHLSTEEARADLDRAAELAAASSICLLCLEGDASRCHRSIVADLLAERLATTVSHLAPVDGF